MAIINDKIYIMRDTNNKIIKLYNKLCYDTKAITFQEIIKELESIIETSSKERNEIKKECDSKEKRINELEDENFKLSQKVENLEYIKESFERAFSCERYEV